MAADGVDLRSLAAAVGSTTVASHGIVVDDVTHDSREAGPGVLFVALRGSTRDGHDYVATAIAAGSPAVCVEDASVAADSPHFVVEDTRAALPVLADLVHGHPSGRLRVVGITGTNGKTTVAHLVEAVGRAAGLPTAVAGTIGGRILDEPFAMARTTPEAGEFQRTLARMADRGVDVAAVEVSSHALALRRTDRTDFAVAAFTNLTQDHLDFHRDMESYYLAKRRLFDQATHAVVWVDDPWGRRLAGEIRIPCLTVGLRDADITGEVEGRGFDGSVVAAHEPGGGAELVVRLAGHFNSANALVAAAIARWLDIDWDTIAAGVSSLSTVPGRFELVDTGRDFTVVVDYAHTPDGVGASIAAARDIVGDRGRLIAVVGAGGDRDRSKRRLMGAAACAADLAILTSDNPRSEDPETILAEVASGATGGEIIIEIDRRAAIRAAVRAARPGDAVLVLGRGHEPRQEIAGRLIPFDDRVVALEEAKAL
jgi:UDP-N-acetylmuramoyl-L-alanyl-D-glutamate--2,6-diaminopimelate ligase